MFENRIALSVTEAAKASGYTPSYIRTNIRQGHLIGKRINGNGDYRILTENLRAWLTGNSQHTATKDQSAAA